jgi:hypothetical protein
MPAVTKRLPVVVVLDNVRSLTTPARSSGRPTPAESSASFCAASRLGRIRAGSSSAIAKTALGAELTVPWEYHAVTAAALSAYAAELGEKPQLPSPDRAFRPLTLSGAVAVASALPGRVVPSGDV